MRIPLPVQAALHGVPLPVATAATTLLYRRASRLLPDLLARLGEHAGKTFLFTPTDLPFAFSIVPARSAMRVSASSDKTSRSDVRIAAPLFLLLALAEGRVDGDAEFFGRQLSIEGDMAAAVALRNALENARLDLVEAFTPAYGPLRSPVGLALRALRGMALEKVQRTWS
jgi:O2-independent ubiquinone biosynthesis accessory factor UbiT